MERMKTNHCDTLGITGIDTQQENTLIATPMRGRPELLLWYLQIPKRAFHQSSAMYSDLAINAVPSPSRIIIQWLKRFLFMKGGSCLTAAFLCGICTHLPQEIVPANGLNFLLT